MDLSNIHSSHFGENFAKFSPFFPFLWTADQWIGFPGLTDQWVTASLFNEFYRDQHAVQDSNSVPQDGCQRSGMGVLGHDPVLDESSTRLGAQHLLASVDLRAEEMHTVFPVEGMAGEFRMRMWRGIKQDAERLSADFASDPGDYGRGEYWSDCPEFSSTYGDLIERELILTHALRLAPREISRLAREYGTTRVESGRAARLASAEKLTADMLAKGYDGIVVLGYESPQIWSACVFAGRLVR